MKYAERAKNIKKKAKRNIKEVEVHMSKYKEIIDGLKGEIDVLRDQLQFEQEKRHSKQTKQRKAHHHNNQNLDPKHDKNEVLGIFQDKENKNTHTSQIVEQVNCISDMSSFNDPHYSIQNTEEINADLEAVKREREELEEKLNSNDISICQAETSYFDKIRTQLYANFEEEWDITHSIAEINELQRENNELIVSLANEMETLIQQKEVTKDQTKKQYIGEQLNMKLNEIENLEKAMQENANVLSEWIRAKDVNEENRKRIQSMFTNIQSSKKKDIIQMQIQMRKLKLEKADLHFQNLQIRKEVMLSKRQNETKDKKLKQLYDEIEQMKRDLAAKDRELERSKHILEKKNEELKHIKKVVVMNPHDVK